MSRRERGPGTPERFFMRRPGGQTAGGFEEGYWKDVVDPDGRHRDRTTERERHIDDVKLEIDFVNRQPPGRILDVGCGLGFFLSAIDEGWEKHGVEVSGFAAAHAGSWGRVFHGTLKEAGYEDSYFDIVVCHHVIEHVEDPVALVNEIHRILRPGGWLVLGTPDFDGGCARRFGENYRLLKDPTHISLFGHESVFRFVRELGFIVELDEYPFFESRHFKSENLERLFDREQVSPPFYGNFMTLFCRKPRGGSVTTALQRLGSLSADELAAIDATAAEAIDVLAECVAARGAVHIDGVGLACIEAELHVPADAYGLRIRTWSESGNEPEPPDVGVMVVSPAHADSAVRCRSLFECFGEEKTIFICDEHSANSGGLGGLVLPVPTPDGWPTGLVSATLLHLLLSEAMARSGAGTEPSRPGGDASGNGGRRR